MGYQPGQTIQPMRNGGRETGAEAGAWVDELQLTVTISMMMINKRRITLLLTHDVVNHTAN